jgi:hypothetical protein
LIDDIGNGSQGRLLPVFRMENGALDTIDFSASVKHKPFAGFQKEIFEKGQLLDRVDNSPPSLPPRPGLSFLSQESAERNRRTIRDSAMTR